MMGPFAIAVTIAMVETTEVKGMEAAVIEMEAGTKK